MESQAHSTKELINTQKMLAEKVIKEDQFDKIEFVAGADISNEAFKPEKPLYAAVVVLAYPEMELVEWVSYSKVTDFPYIPGLLAFREAPVIIKALEKLKTRPDVIMVDGHGVAHPRKLGIASHIGVLTDYPTIGCAKSVLVGTPDGDLPARRGNYVDLIWHKEVIGNVVRTKDNVAPVYVSTGHKVGLDTAREIVLTCARGYRLPEPTRLAHQYANLARKGGLTD